MPIFIHPHPNESESNRFQVYSDNWKEHEDEPSMLVGIIEYFPASRSLEFHPDMPWSNEGLYPHEGLSVERTELTVLMEMKQGREVRSHYSRKLYALMDLILTHRA